MKILIICTFIGVILFSCGPDKKSTQKAKYDEVMAVHDEVMPKMGTIRKLKNELQASADSLMAIDSLSSEAERFLAAIAELEAANESMMMWMRAFSKPEEQTPHEEVLKFYDKELEKVMEVRDKMLTSIEMAEGMD